MTTASADELFQQGMRLLPPWNYEGDDRDERFAAGVSVIREAAEAGSLDAADYLAHGGADDDERMRWSRLLADMGETGPLTSHLTDSDRATMGALVLAAGRSGEAWAMLALSDVYGMGMENGDGVNVATLDGSYGWMPAVPDPDAEARRWLELAVAAGFGPAQLRLAGDVRAGEPARALELVEAGLASEPLHPLVRQRAERLRATLMDELGLSMEEDMADIEATDPVRARALYAQAAAEADVDALRELGRMCEEGIGGPVDLDAAKEHYEQAAEFGADHYARTRLVERWGLDWYAVGPDE